MKYSGAEKDLTLDELEEFIRDARKAGADGRRYIYGMLSTNGKLKEVSVDLSEYEGDYC
ncbi:hypothetical protein [Streptomyces daliensis]